MLLVFDTTRGVAVPNGLALPRIPLTGGFDLVVSPVRVRLTGDAGLDWFPVCCRFTDCAGGIVDLERPEA